MAEDDNASDADLFRQAMAGVTPLNEDDRVVPETPRPAPVPQQRDSDEARVLAELLDGDLDPAELETGEEITFLRPGVQHQVLRRLRRGHFPVQAELDLHGHTRPEAREALRAFIDDSRTRDHRCVRVIHGKGLRSRHRGPVLKQLVDRWLRQLDEVLAFASARPVDGGTGVVYVLLRSRRSG